MEERKYGKEFCLLMFQVDVYIWDSLSAILCTVTAGIHYCIRCVRLLSVSTPASYSNPLLLAMMPSQDVLTHCLYRGHLLFCISDWMSSSDNAGNRLTRIYFLPLEEIHKHQSKETIFLYITLSFIKTNLVIPANINGFLSFLLLCFSSTQLPFIFCVQPYMCISILHQ